MKLMMKKVDLSFYRWNCWWIKWWNCWCWIRWIRWWNSWWIKWWNCRGIKWGNCCFWIRWWNRIQTKLNESAYIWIRWICLYLNYRNLSTVELSLMINLFSLDGLNRMNGLLMLMNVGRWIYFKIKSMMNCWCWWT